MGGRWRVCAQQAGAGLRGGEYYRANGQESLGGIYRQIAELERTEIEVNEYLNVKEFYGWLVIPASLLGLLLPAVGTGLFKKIVA